MSDSGDPVRRPPSISFDRSEALGIVGALADLAHLACDLAEQAEEIRRLFAEKLLSQETAAESG
jgi:hypothetical protein